MFPLWTPDSARVVFNSDRDDGGLFWKAADGTGQVESLWESPPGVGGLQPNSWSTDGRLVFEQLENDIALLTADGDRTVEMLLDSAASERAPAGVP